MNDLRVLLDSHPFGAFRSEIDSFAYCGVEVFELLSTYDKARAMNDSRLLSLMATSGSLDALMFLFEKKLVDAKSAFMTVGSRLLWRPAPAAYLERLLFDLGGLPSDRDSLMDFVRNLWRPGYADTALKIISRPGVLEMLGWDVFTISDARVFDLVGKLAKQKPEVFKDPSKEIYWNVSENVFPIVESLIGKVPTSVLAEVSSRALGTLAIHCPHFTLWSGDAATFAEAPLSIAKLFGESQQWKAVINNLSTGWERGIIERRYNAAIKARLVVMLEGESARKGLQGFLEEHARAETVLRFSGLLDLRGIVSLFSRAKRGGLSEVHYEKLHKKHFSRIAGTLVGAWKAGKLSEVLEPFATAVTVLGLPITADYVPALLSILSSDLVAHGPSIEKILRYGKHQQGFMKALITGLYKAEPAWFIERCQSLGPELEESVAAAIDLTANPAVAEALQAWKSWH